MQNDTTDKTFSLNRNMDSNVPNALYNSSLFKNQIDTLDKKVHDDLMNTPTREELTARLETIETKMDGRIARIEDSLNSKINEVKLEISKSAAEIRSDMQKGQADLIKWVVGTAIALGAVSITVMTFVLNNAVPKQINPATQPTPIVIQFPPQQSLSIPEEAKNSPPSKAANK